MKRRFLPSKKGKKEIHPNDKRAAAGGAGVEDWDRERFTAALSDLQRSKSHWADSAEDRAGK